MQYDPATVPHFSNGSDLSRHYSKIRKGFYDEAAVLKGQATQDAADIRALHRVVGNQLEEVKRLTRDIAAFQAEIDKKRTKLQELKIDLRAIDSAMPIDKITYDAQRIINAIALVYNTTANEICGPRRNRHAVMARFHAIHLLSKNRPDLSLTQLGRLFGNRDHATIINAQRQWPRIVKQLPSHIAAVEAALGILQSEDSALSENIKTA